MLNFIFGCSGSGKTRYVISEIEKKISERKSCYLLVPEQQMYVTECMLANLDPSSALFFEVISFSRLCELIFGRYGGLTYKNVGKAQKNLIMWQSLREISSCLCEYEKVSSDKNFARLMLSAADELHANSVDPEDLEKIIENCESSPFKKKIQDLSLIYANYKRNLSALCGEDCADADDKLIFAQKLLSEHNFFEGKTLFIDSFTDFTGVELDLLKQAMKQADDVYLSLSYEGRGHRAPHTASVTETVKKLTSYAKDNFVEVNDIILNSNTRARSEELVLLEKHLWDYSRVEGFMLPEDSRGAIEMTVCKNEYEEAEYAALRIMQEHARGISYSQIALVMGNADARKGIIAAVFDKYGIPYFFSEKTDISTTPAARLVLCALRCVSRNFRLSDILTLLKTGLCGIDPCDCDLFEDYCITWNINGKTFFEKTWSMNPDGYSQNLSERGKLILEAANRVKDKLIPPLAKLSAEISAAEKKPIAICRALFSYLKEIELSASLCSLAEFELSIGNTRDAGEMIRVYDHINSALGCICETIGNTELTSDELSVAIEILLSNTDIGSVPSVNDYVTVGSASTLRVEGIKTSVLLGLCEGEFPANYSDGAILGEQDKRALEALGISLKSREATIVSDELFYVWRAMSKPSEKLILSTCSSSIDGSLRSPSSAWNRVSFLFPYVKKESFDLYAVRRLAENSAPEERLKKTPYEEENPYIADIDPEMTRLLFGDRLSLTKSKISSFVECPYKFWCEYVLGLRERKPAAVRYGDAGTVIHYVLENFISEVKDSEGRLPVMSGEEIVNKTNDILNRYLLSPLFPLSPSLMYNFSRIRDLSLVMVESVLQEFEASEFRVAGLELPISDKGGILKPLEIPINTGTDFSPVVSLGGIVDRVDVYKNEDGVYIRIVDYKTGAHSFDVRKISDGSDLQLPAYLFAICNEKNKGGFTLEEVYPAAALYLSATEKEGEAIPVRSGFILDDEEILLAANKDMDDNILAGVKFKKNGERSGNALVDREKMSAIEKELKNAISSVAESIYSGKAERRPSDDACRYCSAKANCPTAYKEK